MTMSGLVNDHLSIYKSNISSIGILIALLRMIKILIASFLIVGCLTSLGIDLSTLTSTDSFKCFLSNSHNFVNVRSWHSYGGFDVNAPKTISNAHTAGFSEANIGVYMFPCFSAQKPAANQIS